MTAMIDTLRRVAGERPTADEAAALSFPAFCRRFAGGDGSATRPLGVRNCGPLAPTH